ncbi:carboxypeptidase-like regulatory domain-containing protein [Myxococcota bacterium]|nr:carboxypeptidase-like regulatory domain-containing protein [Myxococcota bacterium]
MPSPSARMMASAGFALAVGIGPSLLACGAAGGPPPPATSGEVEVHLLGLPASTVGQPCGTAEEHLVWAEEVVGSVRPGHGLIRFGACGPRPATSVLPPGSTVVVRNEGRDRMGLRWTQGAEQGQATLAVGGERRIVLGAQGRLELQAEGQAATVVAAPVGGRVDAEGRATLQGLAPGPQRLTVRSAAGDERVATVTVPEGQRVMVEVEL